MCVHVCLCGGGVGAVHSVCDADQLTPWMCWDYGDRAKFHPLSSVPDPIIFSRTRERSLLPLPRFLSLAADEAAVSQLWVSGSQMTFPPRGSLPLPVPKVDTMDPLMVVLCLLPLYPGRNRGGEDAGVSWVRLVPPRLSFLFSSVPSFFSPFLCHALVPTGLATAAPSCPQNVNIAGGSFTLSNGWAPGSILTYSCPLGYYPFPVASRLCNSNGQWQIPRATRSTKPVCKREAPCQRPPQDFYLGIAWGGA